MYWCSRCGPFLSGSFGEWEVWGEPSTTGLGLELGR
jgi:hypothetical protein